MTARGGNGNSQREKKKWNSLPQKLLDPPIQKVDEKSREIELDSGPSSPRYHAESV